MLFKGLREQTVQYLNQALGKDVVRVTAGAGSADLPYFLQDAYDVAPAEVLGHEVALACLKGSRALPAPQVERHVHRMREQLQRPVIVALPQVAPGERKQLIAHGIEFVVPGSQLYAPRLGLILSERFSVETRRELVQVSPATQALLIWFLLQHPVTQLWHPSADAPAMGYTAMTVTRAVRELLQLNLFELVVRGRAKHLKMVMTHRQLWEKAKPHLGTPVQRTLWSYDERLLGIPDARAAGESALTLRTMLVEPSAPVIAVTSDVAARARQDGVFFEPRQLADATEVQVWRYRPTMESDNRTADRLSVWLSLKDSADPRIQMALDEIERGLPW